MSGISVLIKKGPYTDTLCLLPAEAVVRRQLESDRGLSPNTLSAGAMTLDFPAPRTVRNGYKPPSLLLFAIAKWTI